MLKELILTLLIKHQSKNGKKETYFYYLENYLLQEMARIRELLTFLRRVSPYLLG